MELQVDSVLGEESENHVFIRRSGVGSCSEIVRTE